MAGGNSRRLAQLYQEAVYNVAYRVLGDADVALGVTRETFEAVQGMPATARRDDRAARCWLWGRAVRACRRHLGRREGWREPVPAGLEGRIQAGILALPPDDRLVLVLADVQGMSYDDVANILGLPRPAVSASLSRARRTLRDYLLAAQQPRPITRPLPRLTSACKQSD